jgi:hypothetical protein
MGSGFTATTKAATLHGVSFCPNVCFTRFSGLKSLPSGVWGYSTDHAGLEVEEHRAGHVLASRSFVVKHVAAVEARIAVATVHAAAFDAVVVAVFISKIHTSIRFLLLRQLKIIFLHQQHIVSLSLLPRRDCV